MSASLFSFSKNQLNRLFPFFIIINKDLIIQSCGDGLEKISQHIVNTPFSENFTIINLNGQFLDFLALKSVNEQEVKIIFKNDHCKVLVGNFEFLETENHFLFAGTSINDLEINKLSLKETSGVQKEQLLILSQIAEVNTNTVIITDSEDIITWVNQSFTTMTGYSFDEAIGRKPEHLLHGPGTDQKTLDYLNTQVARGGGFNADIYNYSKSGIPYWARIKGQPIHNQNGELTGFFALVEDVTKEKESQEKLKESENRFRIALEKIGNVWEHDFLTGKTFFSKTNNEFWSYTNDELEQSDSNWWDNVHKDDFHLLLSNFKKYRRGKIDSHNEEYRIIHKNGDIRWVLDRGVVIEKDERGRPLRVVGTHTDISDIKRIEAALRESDSNQRALLEAMVGGVFVAQDYRFVFSNPILPKMLGYTEAEFLNISFKKSLHQSI